MSDRQRSRETRRRQGLDLSNEAAAHLERGRPEKALPLLRQALERLPDDSSVLLNLGGAYVLLGRYAEAVAVLERASRLAPGESMVWCNLGAALLGLPGERTDEDRRRAIEAFRHALDLDPKAPNVAYNLGLIHRELGDWAEAARCFALAIDANPDDGDARTLLGSMRALLAGGPPDEGFASGGAGGQLLP